MNKKTKYILIGVLVVGIMFLYIANPLSTQPPTQDVSYKVVNLATRDSLGYADVIVGATVAVEDTGTKTVKSNGWTDPFTLWLFCHYNVTASAPGFETKTIDHYVTRNTGRWIYLNPSGNYQAPTPTPTYPTPTPYIPKATPWIPTPTPHASPPPQWIPTPTPYDTITPPTTPTHYDQPIQYPEIPGAGIVIVSISILIVFLLLRKKRRNDEKNEK